MRDIAAVLGLAGRYTGDAGMIGWSPPSTSTDTDDGSGVPRGRPVLRNRTVLAVARITETHMRVAELRAMLWIGRQAADIGRTRSRVSPKHCARFTAWESRAKT